MRLKLKPLREINKVELVMGLLVIVAGILIIIGQIN